MERSGARHSNADATPGATIDVRTLTIVRLAIAASVMAAAFPWQSFDPLGIGVVFVWAVLTALVLSHELASGLILTTTASLTFVLAYSNGLGDAISDGATQGGVTASSDGVLWAISGLALFLTTLAAVSGYVQRVARRISTAREMPREARPDVAVGLVAFATVCLVAAIDAGTWSQWIGRTESPSVGGLRLELVYPAALLALWGYGTLSRLRADPNARVTTGFLLVGFVAAVLLFVLQSRRQMVAAAILTALAQLMSQRNASLRAVTARVAATLGVLVVLTLASSGWRSGGGDETLDLTERVERALGAVADPKSLEGFESRLTYLWFDAMVHDLSRTQNAELDGGALFVSALVTAIPRSLFAAKAEFEQLSCEAGLEGFAGMDVDLPCTPAGEGFLIWGLLGVLLSGTLWGLTLGVAEACVAKGPGLVRVFGLFLFYPFVLVETGVFAGVQALRLSLIGAISVGLLAALVRTLRGRRGPRAGARTSALRR